MAHRRNSPTRFSEMISELVSILFHLQEDRGFSKKEVDEAIIRARKTIKELKARQRLRKKAGLDI